MSLQDRLGKLKSYIGRPVDASETLANGSKESIPESRGRSKSPGPRAITGFAEDLSPNAPLRDGSSNPKLEATRPIVRQLVVNSSIPSMQLGSALPNLVLLLRRYGPSGFASPVRWIALDFFLHTEAEYGLELVTLDFIRDRLRLWKPLIHGCLAQLADHQKMAWTRLATFMYTAKQQHLTEAQNVGNEILLNNYQIERSYSTGSLKARNRFLRAQNFRYSTDNDKLKDANEKLAKKVGTIGSVQSKLYHKPARTPLTPADLPRQVKECRMVVIVLSHWIVSNLLFL
ncbi:hypothetical protein K469DRAFT_682622 [Zopfia rhizophila CBS 207.26]|uniref:Uncharacterized protein n=1 Tax=Zopfia rhizophila CBS 207.26 TaxID=1314779 RepID=A0A6A6DCV1_9PEZI|nr:hypothetical protein K469DRAFT_682622 [Zopfia rhizophila CBS 207.26]